MTLPQTDETPCPPVSKRGRTRSGRLAHGCNDPHQKRKPDPPPPSSDSGVLDPTITTTTRTTATNNNPEATKTKTRTRQATTHHQKPRSRNQTTLQPRLAHQTRTRTPDSLRSRGKRRKTRLSPVPQPRILPPQPTSYSRDQWSYAERSNQ